MDALILSRTSFSTAERSAVATIDDAFGRGGLRELPLADGVHGPHAPTEGCVNFYTPQPPQSFDRVAIGESVALMDNNWARTFVRHALALTKPGGRLIVLRTPAGARGAQGFLSSAAIDGYLGATAERIEPIASAAAATRLVYGRGAALPLPLPSVLQGFLDAHDDWTGRLVGYFGHGRIGADHSLESKLNPAGGPFAYRHDAFDPSRPSPETIAAGVEALGSSELALRRYASSVNAYLVDGVRYKAAILAHIAKSCIDGAGELSVVDLGSAYGLVPIELCLENRPSIGHALAVEVGYGYTMGACRLLETFQSVLEPRFRFALSSAEAFTFERRYDIVSFIGSLLYVEKPALAQTLDKAWSAVAPGGVLLIHENIRNENYQKDHDFMFSAAEIDQHLGGFGPVRYFMSTGAVEVPRDKVGDKTVFRAVVKPP